jgi:glutathione S-transferase
VWVAAEVEGVLWRGGRAVTALDPAAFFRGVARSSYPELARQLDDDGERIEVSFEAGGRVARAAAAGGRYELEVIDQATYDQVHWAALERPTVADVAAAWDRMMTALLGRS